MSWRPSPCRMACRARTPRRYRASCSLVGLWNDLGECWSAGALAGRFADRPGRRCGRDRPPPPPPPTPPPPHPPRLRRNGRPESNRPAPPPSPRPANAGCSGVPSRFGPAPQGRADQKLRLKARVASPSPTARRRVGGAAEGFGGLPLAPELDECWLRSAPFSASIRYWAVRGFRTRTSSPCASGRRSVFSRVHTGNSFQGKKVTIEAAALGGGLQPKVVRAVSPWAPGQQVRQVVGLRSRVGCVAGRALPLRLGSLS